MVTVTLDRLVQEGSPGTFLLFLLQVRLHPAGICLLRLIQKGATGATA
jgi:hypothetical protein